MIEFSGQVAIVTGAGAGIGRAIALALAARGARLLVNDSAKERAAAVVDEIVTAGGEAIVDTTPVGAHDAARDIVERAQSAFKRIDILINNAGVARPRAFGEGDDSEIDHLLSVNLLGPYALMRAAWPAMRRQEYGRILNASSSAAFGSGVSGPYAAAKAGLIGLTKDAAIAGEPLGIKVNALMPSASTALLDNHPDAAFRAWFQQNMPPASVAAAALWLVSRDMQHTGEVFTAGGGRVSRIAFLESRGVLEQTPTPEAFLDQQRSIMDFTDASIVSTQRDHQINTARAMPGYPL